MTLEHGLNVLRRQDDPLGIGPRLDTILHEIHVLKEKVMAALESLTAQVEATNGAMESAVVLIKGISAALKDAGTNPAKLADLQKSLQTSTDALSEAVAANPLP